VTEKKGNTKSRKKHQEGREIGAETGAPKKGFRRRGNHVFEEREEGGLKTKSEYIV